MVQFLLVHFSVQVPTWWWSMPSRGLWFNRHKGDLYRFQWHCCACGSVTVNLFLSWQHLSLLPTILRDLRVGLSYNKRPVFGIIDYRHWYQLFLQWRLKLLIKLSYLAFLSSFHSRFKFKALITNKHKAIGFSKWVHQFFPITGTILSMLSRKCII